MSEEPSDLPEHEGPPLQGEDVGPNTAPPPFQLPPGVALPMQPLEPQVAPDDAEQTRKLISAIEKIRGSRVIVYWTTPLARMSDSTVPSLYDQLTAIGDVDNIDVVLFTNGGDVEVPWRMVSLIREFAKRFSILIPHRAASAGTLFALGADEIIMTRLAVLGPIDPSRTHPLLPRREGEPPEPVSVQDMRHAMQFIREAGKVEGEFAYTPDAMAQIFTALFDKLHPLAIGAIEQSYALAKLIGRRCLETHMTTAADQEEITRIVDQLCDGYKSHAYQIPRGEAKSIGLKVRNAPRTLDTALMNLYKYYAARPVVPPALPPGMQIKSHIAWLDSSADLMRCVLDQQILPDGNMMPIGDRWERY